MLNDWDVISLVPISKSKGYNKNIFCIELFLYWTGLIPIIKVLFNWQLSINDQFPNREIAYLLENTLLFKNCS